MTRQFFNTAIASLLCFFLITEFTVQSANSEGNEKTSLTTAAKTKNQQKLCKKFTLLIEKGTYKKYIAETENIPDICVYRNLDIDGDGIADKVEVDSGSEGSFLMVQLSGSGEYDLEPGGFIMILKIENRIYAMVTLWHWSDEPDKPRADKITGQDFYLLTKKGAELLCTVRPKTR